LGAGLVQEDFLEGEKESQCSLSVPHLPSSVLGILEKILFIKYHSQTNKELRTRKENPVVQRLIVQTRRSQDLHPANRDEEH
jgi:hypothetical protein